MTFSYWQYRKPADSPPSLVQNVKGAVYVEFLLAFVPVFTWIMCVIQLLLIWVGNLVVHHAANRSTRSAIVVLPDDPQRYGGEPVDSLGLGHAEDPLEALLVGSGLGSPGDLNSISSARLAAIRSAASGPLLAISPDIAYVMNPGSNLHQALGGDGESRYPGAAQYNELALAVNFPSSPGSDRFRHDFSGMDNEELTTRVTYLFHCGVPIAARLMCHSISQLKTGTVLGSSSTLISGRQELNEAGIAWTKLETTQGRFTILRAEATLPYQGARYVYH